MKLLVIEDEAKIASLLKKGLEEQGFKVDISGDGEDGLERATKTPYDAIVIDIMLPKRDGLSVLRTLRTRKVTAPVMIITARGDVTERVEGLNLGADDYMAKPFSMDEVVARVRALIRRVTGESITLYKMADLTMNLVTREVFRGTRRVNLTAREFRLLEHLLRVPGQVVTRTQLIERVWEYHFDPGTNLVDVYIQRLRRKIDDNEELKLIQTVRGVGYCVRAE
ncbi:MAG: response regulator transcription factor [Chthoniobacteraceae bacterium]